MSTQPARAPLPEGIESQLKLIELMTRAECAAILGCSLQAVQQVERRALQKLAARRGAFRDYL